MAKVTIDVGPAVDFTVLVAIGEVPNMSVAVVDRAGPVAIRAGLTVDNAGAGANTFTGSIRKNGVSVVGTVKSLVLIAASRQCVTLEHVDLVAAVGDVYTIEANVAAVVTPTLLLASRCHLVVEALGQDAAFVAGIGPALA